VLLLALIISLIIIPLIIISTDITPFTKPKGIHVKSGSRVFYNFLEKIKDKNDILVLGTSETGNNLNGNNYYSLLNKDKEFNKSVYSFGGAGRSANVYFPLILDNPEAFRNLDVIYYINPTYWRKELNKFSKPYFNRYVDSSFAYSVKDLAEKKDIFNDFMNPASNTGNIALNNLKFSLNRTIDNFRSLYYNDLNSILTQINSTSHTKKNITQRITALSKHKVSAIEKIDIKMVFDSNKINELKQQINLEFNATNHFLEQEADFPSIDTESNYQYEMLTSFIQLCKKYEINCTFYVGPYNEVYCQNKKPSLINEHREVLKNIKQILINNKVDLIDGTSISSVPGTFIDIQHISEYGALLTALQIKKHYEKDK
jgi:hypothetical protein